MKTEEVHNSRHHQRRVAYPRGQSKHHQQGSINCDGREAQLYLFDSQGLQSHQFVGLCLRGTLLEAHLDAHSGIHI